MEEEVARERIEQEAIPTSKILRDALQRADRILKRWPRSVRVAATIALITTMATASQAKESSTIESLIAQPIEGKEITQVQIPPAPEIISTTEATPIPESRLVFREEFENPALPGWGVRPGETGRVTVEDGWLKLEADYGSAFPVVERKDIFPEEGSFEVNFRLDFPEKTGYGVFFTLLDKNNKAILGVSGARCANPFVRTALNNGEEVNQFIIFTRNPEEVEFAKEAIFPGNGWDGSLSNPDVPHVFTLFYDEEGTGYLAIDNTFIGKLAFSSRPVKIRMGNPVTTAESGEWTSMKVNFLEVRKALEPSFALPENPPFYELALFKEMDGDEMKGVSALSLPPGENWALEIEATFSHFSLPKPALLQFGDLKILGSSGWEPYIALSAGKEAEKFGYLISPDVGSVKGQESLRRPKIPHIFRLVHLEGKVYLYVDSILVGQGPGDEIAGKIPVGISEERDGTKVNIENVKLFSVSP